MSYIIPEYGRVSSPNLMGNLESRALKQEPNLFRGYKLPSHPVETDLFQSRQSLNIVQPQLRFGFRKPEHEYSQYRFRNLQKGTQALEYFKKYRLFLPKLSMAGLSKVFFRENAGRPRSFWVGSGVVIEKTGEVTQGQSLAGMAYYLALAELLRRDFGYDNITWTIGDADAKKVRPASEHDQIDDAAREQLKMLQNVIDRFHLESKYRILLSSELPDLFVDIRSRPGYTSPDELGEWHAHILEILEQECGEFFDLSAIQAMEEGGEKQEALADAKRKMEYVTTQIDDMIFSVQAENAEGRLGWATNDKIGAVKGKWDERTFNELYQIVCRQLREKYKAVIPDNYSFIYAQAEIFPGKSSACPYSVSKEDIKSRILMTDSEDEVCRKLASYIQAAHSTKRSRFTGTYSRTSQAREAINTLQFLQKTIWVFYKAFRAEAAPARPEDLKFIYFDPAKGNELVINEDALLTELLRIQKYFLTPTPAYHFLPKADPRRRQAVEAETLSLEPDYSLERRIRKGISPRIAYQDGYIWHTSVESRHLIPAAPVQSPEIPAVILEQGSLYDDLLATWNNSEDQENRIDIEIALMDSCADYVRALHYTAKEEVLQELKDKGLKNAAQFFTLPDAQANIQLEKLRFQYLLQTWDDLTADRLETLRQSRVSTVQFLLSTTDFAERRNRIQDELIEKCPNYINSLASGREKGIRMETLKVRNMDRAFQFYERQMVPRLPESIRDQEPTFYWLIRLWEHNDSYQNQQFRNVVEDLIMESGSQFISALPRVSQKKPLRILQRRHMDEAFSAYNSQSTRPMDLTSQENYFHQLMKVWQMFAEWEGEQQQPPGFGDTLRDNIETLMTRHCPEYLAPLSEPAHLRMLARMKAQGMLKVYDFCLGQSQARAGG